MPIAQIAGNLLLFIGQTAQDMGCFLYKSLNAFSRMKKETAMTMNVSLPTAKIYQFPVGGRSALPGYRTQVQPAAEQAPTVDVTGWYHEAAIEEASRGREH